MSEEIRTSLPSQWPISIQRSEKIEEFLKAFNAAQVEMEPAEMNGYNPHFGTKYSTMADVRKATKPLKKHGIVVVQTPTTKDGRVEIVTLLIHVSGQYLASSISTSAQNSPQGIGSAITYMCRYALSAITGVSSEDDDGSAGTKPANNQKSNSQQNRPQQNQKFQQNRPPQTHQKPAPKPAPTPTPKQEAKPVPQTQTHQLNGELKNEAPEMEAKSEDSQAFVDRVFGPEAGDRETVSDMVGDEDGSYIGNPFEPKTKDQLREEMCLRLDMIGRKFDAKAKQYFEELLDKAEAYWTEEDYTRIITNIDTVLVRKKSA